MLIKMQDITTGYGEHDAIGAFEVDAVIRTRADFGAKLGQDLPMSFTYDDHRWDHYSTGILDGRFVAVCYRRRRARKV